MPTLPYMPHDDAGKAELLEHLAAIMPKYAELLEIKPEDIATLQADAFNFRLALQEQGDWQSFAQHWTAFKNQLRDDEDGQVEWPVPPLLGSMNRPAVLSGIIPRTSTLVAHLKTHKKFTTAIGQDLWVIGTSHVIDPTTWKPILNVQIIAGHPVIVWTKGKAGGIEIWVDRNDGNGFVLLAVNNEPNTTDPTPLPAPGTSATWKYKAIYRLHDAQVGQWSDVMSISVGG
jgi:hypothetical protein